jgi:ADP-ribose pyrophosphatase YjhB (NUDIX family)
MPHNKTVRCITPSGEYVDIPEDKIVPRLAAYGIVLSPHGVLLGEKTEFMRLWLPGGGIDAGEDIEKGLKREVLEETGVACQVQKLLATRKDYTHIEREQISFDQESHFFLCTSAATKPYSSDAHEALIPKWFPLNIAQQKKFVVMTEFIHELLKSKAVQDQAKLLQL